METRKIQKVGASTLTVSLPKDWVTRRGVHQGDQVVLQEEGATLRIVPAAAYAVSVKEEYVIDAGLCDKPGLLTRVLVGNYVLGRDRLLIQGEGRLSSEHLAETREAARRLMGVGIIEETATKISLQCSIDPTRYPIDALLKRMYNISQTMLEESVEALVTRDPALARDAIAREDDADTLYYLVLRLILSAQMDEGLLEPLGIKSRLEIAGDRAIARDLEGVADHCEDIARNVLFILDKNLKVPDSVVKSLKTRIERVKKAYTSAIAALLSHDIHAAYEAGELAVAFQDDLQTLTRQLLREGRSMEMLVAMRSVIQGLSRMGEYAKSISMIAVNRYLERPTNLCRPVETKG